MDMKEKYELKTRCNYKFTKRKKNRYLVRRNYLLRVVKFIKYVTYIFKSMGVVYTNLIVDFNIVVPIHKNMELKTLESFS